MFLKLPELKAQVSCFNRLLSVVRPSVYKLFAFSSSSPEPLDLFQPNLAQRILWVRGFNFFPNEGPALFQGEIITK